MGCTPNCPAKHSTAQLGIPRLPSLSTHAVQVMTLWQCSLLLAKCHPHFPDLISVVSYMVDVAQQQEAGAQQQQGQEQEAMAVEVQEMEMQEAEQQQGVPPGAAA